MVEKRIVGSKRSFLFIFLVSIVTLGIYWLYWYYKTNSEIKEYAKLNSSPLIRLLMLLFGWILLGLPTIYAYYAWLRDISEEARKNGVESFSPIIHILLLFVPFGTLYTVYCVQATLNNLWDSSGKEEKKPALTTGMTDDKKNKEEQEDSETVLKCPRCRTKNKEYANYCVRCGEKLG